MGRIIATGLGRWLRSPSASKIEKMGEFSVRLATISDCDQLAGLRRVLWPEGSSEEHRQELSEILQGRPVRLPVAILVAEADDGALVGFLEAGLRSHADGCDTRQPVGFMEGWFVAPSWRGLGVGARLLAAAESWARMLGCREIASDTRIDNELSQRVHEALGFTVVDRCVHYRKALGATDEA